MYEILGEAAGWRLRSVVDKRSDVIHCILTSPWLALQPWKARFLVWVVFAVKRRQNACSMRGTATGIYHDGDVYTLNQHSTHHCVFARRQRPRRRLYDIYL